MNITKARATGVSLLALLSATNASAETLAEIEAAARKDGMLTTIALPHDWCNCGEIIASFKAKCPEITVNGLNPDAGSADELEAICASRDNTGPQAPDVIDTGLAFGPQAQAEGLIQPCKVSAWDEIPAGIKDPDGHWAGSCSGVMAIGVNRDLVTAVPAKWDGLLKAVYASAVALTGDPRASNQAILAVMAAGMSRGAEPGDASGTKGLEFMAELNKAGNFVAVAARAGTIAQGQTPVVAARDDNLLAWRDSPAGNPPVEVVIPEGPVLAGVYVQAISACAPHPDAGKLWMEHLFSDQGQNGDVKGYGHTARFNRMVAAGKVPQELPDALPPADAYTRAVFPSVDQQSATKAVVTGQRDAVVGAQGAG